MSSDENKSVREDIAIIESLDYIQEQMRFISINSETLLEKAKVLTRYRLEIQSMWKDTYQKITSLIGKNWNYQYIELLIQFELLDNIRLINRIEVSKEYHLYNRIKNIIAEKQHWVIVGDSSRQKLIPIIGTCCFCDSQLKDCAFMSCTVCKNNPTYCMKCGMHITHGMLK